MIVYVVGWTSPGCLPDNEPAAFDNELAAREYMRDEFRRLADSAGDDADTWDQFADDMEFHGDAAMGCGDSYWDGPDGYVYFIESHDWTNDEWREYLEEL